MDDGVEQGGKPTCRLEELGRLSRAGERQLGLVACLECIGMFQLHDDGEAEELVGVPCLHSFSNVLFPTEDRP